MNLEEGKKIEALEKTTDFGFLIKLVAFMCYVNTVSLATNGNGLSTETKFIFTTNIPIGKATIEFAGFCFLMSWVLPILRYFLQLAVGHTLDSLFSKITHQAPILLQRDGFFSEWAMDKIFAKTANKYIEKLIDANQRERICNEARAKVAFSLSVLLVADVVVSLMCGSYHISFVYLVCSLGNHLPELMSTLFQVFIWTFAAAILFLGLSWRLHEQYIFIPDEIVKALNLCEILKNDPNSRRLEGERNL
jgi:hypothetical protein